MKYLLSSCSLSVSFYYRYFSIQFLKLIFIILRISFFAIFQNEGSRSKYLEKMARNRPVPPHSPHNYYLVHALPDIL